MIQYTTPSISLIIEGIDISAYDIYVSLEQGATELTKQAQDLVITTEGDNTIITLTLSQEETAAFDVNKYVNLQVNYIKDGVRAATEIKYIKVMRNILNEVI